MSEEDDGSQYQQYVDQREQYLDHLVQENAGLTARIAELESQLAAAESRGMKRAAKLCEGEVMDLDEADEADKEYDAGCRACASVIRRDIARRTAAQEKTNDAK